MDKEILRIVIIATGLLVSIGMILWSYLNSRQTDEDDEVEIRHEKAIGSKGNIDESLRIHHENDDYDIIPIGSARESSAGDSEIDWDDELNGDFDGSDETGYSERQIIPDVLQFAIVAPNETGFKGNDIANALDIAGLEYGNLKVYERINALGQVNYGVACITQPGTFPEGDAMDSFTCPGIVFYLQHGDLDDAQEVFEDFVESMKLVAKKLGGEIWDHQRKPLTDATLQIIRMSL